MAELPYAWSCLACPESGAGPKSDLAARKHEDATKHATTTHLERAEWSDPVRVGEVLPDVIEHMRERDGYDPADVPHFTPVSGENGGGPDRGVDAPQPGPDHLLEHSERG